MVDRDRFGLFLRTLVGLLLVDWMVVAMVAPPDPLTFLVWLVPGWVGVFPVAAYLVYFDGYRKIRESPFYQPGDVRPSRTVVWFVVFVLVAKAAFTAVDRFLFGTQSHAVGVAASIAALVAGYVFVYQGVVARALGAAGQKNP